MLSASLYYNYSKNNYWVWGDDIVYEHGNGQVTKVDKALLLSGKSFGVKVKAF